MNIVRWLRPFLSEDRRWALFVKDAEVALDPRTFIREALADPGMDKEIRVRILQTIFQPDLLPVPDWWPTFRCLFLDASEEVVAFTEHTLETLPEDSESPLDAMAIDRFNRFLESRK